jgi:hypothetical protein
MFFKPCENPSDGATLLRCRFGNIAISQSKLRYLAGAANLTGLH